MFSVQRIYGYIFLLSLFPVQILNCELFKSADELICVFLLLLAGIDVYVHGINSFSRYKFILIVTSIMVAYTFYSLFFCSFNTPVAILSDFVSQIKPFAVFGLTLAFGVSLDGVTKGWLRIASLVNAFFMLCTVMFWVGDYYIFGHPGNFGSIMLLSSMAFIYGSMDENKKIDSRDICISISMLLLGLFCTRSKYYGELLLFLFLLFGYKPGLQRHVSFKHILVAFVVLSLIIVVTWSKINYYFIEGANDVFSAASDDESMSYSFARPVLYAVASVLLVDFFPLGTGLASYASFASEDPYSSLYYDYGVNVVYGLSPDYPAFICDAYYPTLAQFGIIGVLLFLGFWIWVLKTLNKKEHLLGDRFKYFYILGLMCIIYVFIESIGSTVFVQGHGMFIMMLLALIINEKTQVDHG